MTRASAPSAFIVDGCRTAMGKVGGALASIRPDDLAALAIRSLVERNPGLDPNEIEDVYWGATNQAGEDNRNVARLATLLAGLPITVAGATVNRLCGSGMQAVVSAAHSVIAGDTELCIAGGSESMSRAPFVLPRAESAYQAAQPIADSRLGWRLVNPRWHELYDQLSLGQCAEYAAEKFGVSRERQDDWAVRSHRLAAHAWDSGRFAAEAIPVPLKKGGALERDETVRADSSMETLAKLRPVFVEGGSVTAGNSSPMNDGAAAVLIASEAAVERYGLTPIARYVASGSVGVHPDLLTGPVPACHKVLAKAGWSLDEVDLIELNEAFASQTVACIDELNADPERVNVNGGAIAMGHPLGASGARLVTTLVHELRRRGDRKGLATMCIGVGQGIALALETV
ncbi:MAG: acetyl-CoA C-acyltransferase [Acidimicrobiia bacterium]